MRPKLPAGRCLMWGCGKPLRDANGKRAGARGMCWKHLKQAQREESLLPYEPPAPGPCSGCGTRPARWAALCSACYYRRNRQVSPNREARLARDRERKRGVADGNRGRELSVAHTQGQ